MSAQVDNAHQGRSREALIFGAFVLICAAGVFSVLLPETRNDAEKDDAPAAASAASAPVAPAPAK